MSTDVITTETTERERIASGIVIRSYERDAEEARALCDLVGMQEIQDAYHEARLKRADAILGTADDETASTTESE